MTFCALLFAYNDTADKHLLVLSTLLYNVNVSIALSQRNNYVRGTKL